MVREQHIVTSVLNRSPKMGVAELDLERDPHSAQTNEMAAAQRPLFQARPDPHPSGFADDDVLAVPLPRLPEGAAHEIIRRKTDYKKTYGLGRLVYAASEPFAMAAMFISPWLEPEIVSQPSAAYRAGSLYPPVSFGRVLDEARDVTLLDRHYLVPPLDARLLARRNGGFRQTSASDARNVEPLPTGGPSRQSTHPVETEVSPATAKPRVRSSTSKSTEPLPLLPWTPLSVHGPADIPCFLMIARPPTSQRLKVEGQCPGPIPPRLQLAQGKHG
jgi:hypothetical protein